MLVIAAGALVQDGLPLLGNLRSISTGLRRNKMAPTRESLLNTVRALLEMTEARGCTAPEAALARSKAIELIEKYGITLRDLSGPPSVARVPISPRPSHNLDPENARPF